MKVILFDSLVYDVVFGNYRRGLVDDLGVELFLGVEDGVVESIGEGFLVVRGDIVRDNVFLFYVIC